MALSNLVSFVVILIVGVGDATMKTTCTAIDILPNYAEIPMMGKVVECALPLNCAHLIQYKSTLPYLIHFKLE